MGRPPVLSLLTITWFTYFLVLSSAVPISRLQRMPFQEAGGEMPLIKASSLEPKMGTERSVPEDEATTHERMTLEMQDYQPSGPNGKHRPPGWR